MGRRRSVPFTQRSGGKSALAKGYTEEVVNLLGDVVSGAKTYNRSISDYQRESSKKMSTAFESKFIGAREKTAPILSNITGKAVSDLKISTGATTILRNIEKDFIASGGTKAEFNANKNEIVKRALTSAKGEFKKLKQSGASTVKGFYTTLNTNAPFNTLKGKEAFAPVLGKMNESSQKDRNKIHREFLKRMEKDEDYKNGLKSSDEVYLEVVMDYYGVSKEQQKTQEDSMMTKFGNDIIEENSIGLTNDSIFNNLI